MHRTERTDLSSTRATMPKEYRNHRSLGMPAPPGSCSSMFQCRNTPCRGKSCCHFL